MKIEWLGHATFIITSNKGTKILTDPYEPGGFSGAVKYSPIKETVDIITISHSHKDHCHIPSGLTSSTQILRDKTDTVLKDIKIKTVESFHDCEGGRERGCNTIFLLEVDGIRIAHFGDLGHPLDDAKIKELGQIDVALIPVGGIFTLDAKLATDTIRKINPKIVIPMHFKTAKLGFNIDEVEVFLKGKENVEILKNSEIEIKPDMLSSPTAKIMVLQHSH